MDVLAVQLDIAWEDKPANHTRVRALVEASQPPAGALVVLPEMFATGYSMNVAGIADGVDGETTRFLRELAREFNISVLAGLVTTTPAGRGLNQAVWIAPDGQERARYTKIHPFTAAGEAESYDAGTATEIVEWQGASVAPAICYDLRFPEVFRQATRQGAEVFAVIANWPAARADHWRTLLAARAIENQAYVIGVNRTGTDPNEQYGGGSVVLDPRGEPVAMAGAEETVLRARLDLAGLRSYRREFPVLADAL